MVPKVVHWVAVGVTVSVLVLVTVGVAVDVFVEVADWVGVGVFVKVRVKVADPVGVNVNVLVAESLGDVGLSFFFLQATDTNRTDNKTAKNPEIKRRFMEYPFFCTYIR